MKRILRLEIKWNIENVEKSINILLKVTKKIWNVKKDKIRNNSTGYNNNSSDAIQDWDK